MKAFTESEIAEFIINILQAQNVPPDEEFTAAAGNDYGYVAAYMLTGLAGVECYAIQYRSKDKTGYVLCERADYLTIWLELPNLHLNGLDAVTHAANLYSTKSIKSAIYGDKGPFYVLTTIERDGSQESNIEHDSSGKPLEFLFFIDAQEWVNKSNFHLGATAKTTYKIITERV